MITITITTVHKQTTENLFMVSALVGCHVDHARRCAGRPELVGDPIKAKYVRGLVRELWPDQWGFLLR